MPTPKTFQKRLILLVVDAASSYGILQDYLTGSGYDVVVANNGESALTLVRHLHPSLILLDVILPGIDGFETCRRLKSRSNTQDIPVIFITELDNTVDKVRGFSLGAVDYITKPLQSEEVLARMRTHLTIQDLKQRLEEKNTRLKEEIQEREKLIGELDAFAHTVAHDLKNPLGVTISYASFLKKFSTTMSTEEMQNYSDVIVRNAHKMANIIDELLLLASARQDEVTLKPLDMAHIVTEAQHRLSYMIEEYDAEIIMPDKWPRAVGYAPWVEEVWMNYLSNAMKYGGTPPRVEIGSMVQSDGMVRFRVWDNGDGLTAEEQEKLFKPFTRLDETKASGHGLGLSIVQRIVEKLGGEVGVESEGVPGQGSVFSFTLPQDK